MKKSKVLLVSLLASLGVIGISGTSLHYSSQYLNFGIVAKADASVPNAITSRGGSNTDLLSPTDPGYKGTKILQGVQVVSGNEGSSYNTNGIDLLENVKSLDVVVTLQNPTGQSADVSESITLPVNKASGPVFTVGDNTNESLLKSPEKFDLPNNWTLAFGISGYTYTDSPNIADADNTVDTQNKVDAVQFRGTLAAYTKVQVKIPVKVDTEGFTNSGMGALASALYVKDDKGNYQVAGGPLATIGVVDKSIVASDYTANAGVKPEPKLFKVTTPANGDGVTISKIVDANGNNVPIDTTLSTPGIYKVTLNAPGYGSATVALTVTGGSTGGSTGGTTTTTTPAATLTPATNVPTNSSSSTSSSSSSTTTTTTTKPSTSVGPNIAVKGEAVYAIKKIGLYKSTSFTKSKRIAWYPKQKRANRPMFVVTGYKRTSNGTLRYKVRDVNHGSKTAGKKGYITASRKYVVPVYYASVPKSKKITVIAKKGINTYKSANLTGKAKHYKKGVRLTVKKLVKHNLTTRYQLSNGHYVTANKKLIIAGNY